VSLYTVSDLRQVKEHNNTWSSCFYEAVAEFESLKPEERASFKANLLDSFPPSWTDVVNHDNDRMQENDEDDVEAVGVVDKSYTKRNRVPPIKICLWYNPLMYISPSVTRSEWEQQLGGFPAFFIYTMSRYERLSPRIPNRPAGQ
jgi:hypothetical protein